MNNGNVYASPLAQSREDHETTQVVCDTLDGWVLFMNNWELTKKSHLRIVLPVEDRERLRDWDKFLDRFA